MSPDPLHAAEPTPVRAGSRTHASAEVIVPATSLHEGGPALAGATR